MTDYIGDADIDAVIAKSGGDIRKVAAAYIRASRRANSADERLRLAGMVSDLQRTVMAAAMEGRGYD